MKVLQIVNEPTPGAQGGSTHIWEVAKGLTKLGWEVVTIAPLIKSQTSFDDYRDGHKVYRFKIDFFRRLPILYLFKINEIIKKEVPDIILERATSLGGAGMLFPTKLPKVLEVNAPMLENALVMKEIPFPVYWLLKQYQKIIFSLADSFKIQDFGCIPEKYHKKATIIEPGAATEYFKAIKKRKNRKIKIIYSGAMYKWHGVLEFLKQMPVFPDNVFFTFVGEGKEYEEAKKYENKHIKFLGMVPYKNMPLLLSKHDIGIAPFDVKHMAGMSGWFFKPIKIYEYMASGLPFVTFEIGSVRDIVGFGYPLANTWQEFFDILYHLINDENFRENLSKQGFDQIKKRKLTWEEHSKKYDKLLRGTINNAKKN